MKRRTRETIEQQSCRKHARGDAFYDIVYTKDADMKKIIAWAEQKGCFNDIKIFIDPSAGDGAIEKYLPEHIKYEGSDIEPTAEHVKKMNYNDIVFDKGNDNVTCVGFNPPFGFCGNEAKKYIEWVIEKINPAKMLLVLPHIAGGWLPDGYRPVEFMDAKNIFVRKASGKNIPVLVRVYIFERDTSYKHKYDISKRYENNKCPHVKISSHTKDFEWQKPVLWVKRCGRVSGRVSLIDTGDKEWDYLTEERKWTRTDPAEIPKSMKPSGTWVQINGVCRCIMREMGEWFAEKISEDDIRCHGSSLSAKKYVGSISVECINYYTNRFFEHRGSTKCSNCSPTLTAATP